jgi:hypothetical protein
MFRARVCFDLDEEQARDLNMNYIKYYFIMLKRKANVQEFEEVNLSSESEIRKRIIYRARRPCRSVPSEFMKFRMTTTLISKEEEQRLLSCDSSYRKPHSRTRSENPFSFFNFSGYSLLEPFKEIIQNHPEGNLRDFLTSGREKERKVQLFEDECFFFTQDKVFRAFCEIFRENESFFFSVNCRDGSRVEGKIWKSSTCREVWVESQSFLNVFLENEKNFKISMNQMSLHLFLRCFSEAKMKSFF